jgi:N-dimethylarginine dimethylaminohydrolase
LHFDVTYKINPWMDPDEVVDADLAIHQWEQVAATYLELGHQVDLIEPVPELPDMVFAANAALVLDGRAYCARFSVEERRGEEGPDREWFRTHGYDVIVPTAANEGAGDLLAVGRRILAGHGFRTTLAAHREVARHFEREVVSLELVDPHYYHLDTALSVLDDETIAWFPGAFAPSSQRTLEDLFPDALVASAADAAAFGLNATSDGLNVVLSSEATGLIDQLRQHGYRPIGLDLSELRKAGGGAKCCTLELT